LIGASPWAPDEESSSGGAISARSGRDRGAIGSRSRRDRRALAMTLRLVKHGRGIPPGATMSESATATAPRALDGFDDPAFRARRTQNWMVLGLLYAFFYATRYNLSAVSGQLCLYFGWTNTQYGVFETMMPFVYGVSVLVNGPLADRIGGKKAFLFGALGVVAANVLFGLGTTLVVTPAVWQGTGKAAVVLTPAVLRYGLSSSAAVGVMATIWGINGYFQSFGALSIVKVNAQWFHLRERGTFAGIFGVLIRFGLILAFVGVPALAGRLSLVWAFWVPGAGVAMLFLLNYFLMENAPADAGFTGLDTGDGSTVGDEKPAPLGEILKKVFTSRVAWTIAVGSMMIGFVRRSTVDVWFAKYFANNWLPKGMPLSDYWPYQGAAWGIALLGIAGGFAFGMSSDRIFKSRRGPVITIGFAGMAVLLTLLGLAQRYNAGPWAMAAVLAGLSFFINGAHGMIGGAASMDFGGRKAAATAAGLFDGIQYFTSAPFVGMGMGWVLDSWGWGAWSWVPIPFAIIGALVMSTLWNVTPGKRGH
jgi:OPA family glycerol-3-phosphate transporter-like MFS transporter